MLAGLLTPLFNMLLAGCAQAACEAVWISSRFGKTKK
jgi:hypothetical protein